MEQKVRANIVGETLETCENLTLFYFNKNKVIGTADFSSRGCEIVILDFINKKEDYDIMLSNGLYEIIGTLRGLEPNQLNEIDIDKNLLPQAIEYVKKHNVDYEIYSR